MMLEIQQSGSSEQDSTHRDKVIGREQEEKSKRWGGEGGGRRSGGKGKKMRRRKQKKRKGRRCKRKYFLSGLNEKVNFTNLWFS